MSWSVSVTEDAKHAAPRFEQEINARLHGRNGFEQTAMKATVPVVETLAKHAALTPHKVTAGAWGHIDENGIGETHVSVTINAGVEEHPE
jgi:hypothetical protein